MSQITIDEALNLGVDAHKAGKTREADHYYTAILQAMPNHPDANHNKGILIFGLGKHKDALPFFQKAIEANPSVEQFWVSYIDALVQLGQVADAKSVIEKARSDGVFQDLIKKLEARLEVKHNVPSENPPQEVIDHLISLYNQGQLESAADQAQALTLRYPGAFIVWNILGVVSRGLGRIVNAADAFRKVTELNPSYADGFSQLGVTLKAQGKLEEAVENYKKSLVIKPDSAQTYNNLGNAFRDQGNLDEAIDAYVKALSLKPDYAIAYNNMGNTLKDQSKHDEAIDAYNKALSIQPDYAEVYYNMGIVLQDQDKIDDAIDVYRKALSLQSDYAEVHNNIGVALNGQGKLEEAIEAYNNALSIQPDYAEAYNNMGITLKEQGKLHEALEAYISALSIKPDYAEADNNMGITLLDSGEIDAAVVAYNKAVSLKPDYVEAYYNMGIALQEKGDLEAAIVAYSKALSLKPDHEEARAQRLYQQASICDWVAILEDSDFIAELGISKKDISPLSLIAIDDSPERQRSRSEIYAKARYPQRCLSLPDRAPKKPKRIRIGYISADFKIHPVAYLISKFLELHDRNNFEVFGYSISRKEDSDIREKIVNSLDLFREINHLSDQNAVEMIRKDQVDILVDLTGFTQGSRAGILALRAAPIQINFLGFPSSMGAEFIDYIIADEIVIPEHQRHNYSENVIYMPNSYMCTDNTREFSERPLSRAELGLPEEAFVFCCFNNNVKITSREFDIWMRLLNRLEGSVLWLGKSNIWSTDNLIKEARRRGVDSCRLIFADKVPMDQHLERQRLADLFLDTFNFNAHTTASEALWAGLPVVTKVGNQFAARVAASLLTAVGLPELVTKTEEEYEGLIFELASDKGRLSATKAKLAMNRLKEPLFDTERYTRNFEAGLIKAFDLYFDDQKTQDISVKQL